MMLSPSLIKFRLGVVARTSQLTESHPSVLSAIGGNYESVGIVVRFHHTGTHCRVEPLYQKQCSLGQTILSDISDNLTSRLGAMLRRPGVS